MTEEHYKIFETFGILRDDSVKYAREHYRLSPEDAYDCLQDATLLAISRGLDSWESSRLRAYIFGCFKNNCRNRRRRIDFRLKRQEQLILTARQEYSHLIE
ncbi:MAG: hypothetical protein AABW89_06060 [Nanoarchaeota archaeon]